MRTLAFLIIVSVMPILAWSAGMEMARATAGHPTVVEEALPAQRIEAGVVLSENQEDCGAALAQLI